MGVHAYLRDKLFPNVKKVDAYDSKFTGLHLFGSDIKPRPRRLDPNFFAFQNIEFGPHQEVYREHRRMHALHTLPAAMRRGPRPDGSPGWMERWEERMAQDPNVQVFMQQLQQQQQGGGGGGNEPAGSQRGSHRGGTRGRDGRGGGGGTRLPQLDEDDDLEGWEAGSQGAGQGQMGGSGRGSARRYTRRSTRQPKYYEWKG